MTHRVCSQWWECGLGLEVSGNAIGGLEAIGDVGLECSLSLQHLRILCSIGRLVANACKNRLIITLAP